MNFKTDNLFLNTKHIQKLSPFMITCDNELYNSNEEYEYGYDDDDYEWSDYNYIDEGVRALLEGKELIFQFFSNTKTFEMDEAYIFDYEIFIPRPSFYLVKENMPHLLL